MSHHPVVIIGSGPAGLTAAIYTARANLTPVAIAEGTYKVDVALYPLYRRRVPLDEVKGAAELQVLASDFFGGGKMPAISEGPALLEGRWNHES